MRNLENNCRVATLRQSFQTWHTNKFLVKIIRNNCKSIKGKYSIKTASNAFPCSRLKNKVNPKMDKIQLSKKRKHMQYDHK